MNVSQGQMQESQLSTIKMEVSGAAPLAVTYSQQWDSRVMQICVEEEEILTRAQKPTHSTGKCFFLSVARVPFIVSGGCLGLVSHIITYYQF